MQFRLPIDTNNGGPIPAASGIWRGPDNPTLFRAMLACRAAVPWHRRETLRERIGELLLTDRVVFWQCQPQCQRPSAGVDARQRIMAGKR